VGSVIRWPVAHDLAGGTRAVALRPSCGLQRKDFIMGVLRSDLFKGDAKLEACATNPVAHIAPASPGGAPPRGPHVGKIQAALATLLPAGPAVSDSETSQMIYGVTSAAAVLKYKQDRSIIGSYQRTADNIVGQLTIQKMDEELCGTTASRDDIVKRAFSDSRNSLRAALHHLTELRTDINRLPSTSDPAMSAALLVLLAKHRRNIAVLSRRLFLTADPTRREFRSALDQVISLVQKNLAHPNTILAAGQTGLCDPKHPRNAGGLPFAWTSASQADPKTHLCDPFFNFSGPGDSRDLQRDVITHEYFHLFGLLDIHVTDTATALKNSHTVTQVVAFLSDRFRQVNAGGTDREVPPLPSP
jgi:hypothetical protein